MAQNLESVLRQLHQCQDVVERLEATLQAEIEARRSEFEAHRAEIDSLKRTHRIELQTLRFNQTKV